MEIFLSFYVNAKSTKVDCRICRGFPRWMTATNLPVKNEKGEYIATKTAGMPGTQADVIRAVQSQNVFMVHVVDAHRDDKSQP